MFSVKKNFLKVIATSILIVNLFFPLVGIKCFSSISPGDSTENPIVLASVQDLEALVEDVNEGISYSGKYFVLRKDICIKENNKVLSNSKEPVIKGKFNGVFDGNGHTIIFKTKNSAQEDKRVLFDYLGKNAAIKNLNIKGNISSVASEKNDNIKNCHILED